MSCLVPCFSISINSFMQEIAARCDLEVAEVPAVMGRGLVLVVTSDLILADDSLGVIERRVNEGRKAFMDSDVLCIGFSEATIFKDFCVEYYFKIFPKGQS